MEKHVVSKIICERLKALGVKQESEFYWVESQINHKWVIERKEMVRLEIFGDSATSAFLASELGEMLPDLIIRHDKKLMLQIMKFDGIYFVIYLDIENVLDQTKHWDNKNLADAFALMLEYLIQNKLI